MTGRLWGAPLAGAGLVAPAVMTAQLLGVLSAFGLIPQPTPDDDGAPYALVAGTASVGLVVAALCVVPSVVFAVLAWRRGEGRITLLVMALLLFVWHVAGVVITVNGPSLDLYGFFAVPGPPEITVGYQAVLAAALAVATVMLATAVAPPRRPGPAIWWQQQVEPGNDRPGQQPPSYRPTHL